MKEQIKVVWMPKAKAMDFIVKGLLERSHARFLENNRKDVVSEYLGGNIIIITTEADGECFQIAFERSELGLASRHAGVAQEGPGDRRRRKV
jgi:hypothetical protein